MAIPLAEPKPRRVGKVAAPRLWKPVVGSTVVAYIPDERIRATVTGYLSDNVMTVCIDQIHPFSKSHSIRWGDTIHLKREQMAPIGEKWVYFDPAKQPDLLPAPKPPRKKVT